MVWEIFTNHSYFSTRRLAWHKPSPTLTKSDTGTRCGVIHPQGDRLITVAEMKRLQSFPDGYQFPGGYRRAAERIGNSVPPRFMQAMAEHIRDEILEPAREKLKHEGKPHTRGMLPV